jgi:hypothetical protein
MGETAVATSSAELLRMKTAQSRRELYRQTVLSPLH